ncbi:MAG: hypothetical protein KDK37_02625 [Leptospiraceae bacterium]|nr:hypothetical protein [Leptospiraceae bacterium]
MRIWLAIVSISGLLHCSVLSTMQPWTKSPASGQEQTKEEEGANRSGDSNQSDSKLWNADTAGSQDPEISKARQEFLKRKIPAAFRPQKTVIPPALKLLQPQKRSVTVEPDRTTSIQGKNGMKITIPANALDVPAECGTTPVTADYKEITSSLDVIASGSDMLLSPDSDPGTAPVILESAGMFDLKIKCGDRDVPLKPGQTLQLDHSGIPANAPFQLYRRTPDGWSLAENSMPEPDSQKRALTKVPVLDAKSRLKISAPNMNPAEYGGQTSHVFRTSSQPGMVQIGLFPDIGIDFFVSAPGYLPRVVSVPSQKGPGVYAADPVLLRPMDVAIKRGEIQLIGKDPLTQLGEVYRENVKCKIVIVQFDLTDGKPRRGASGVWLDSEGSPRSADGSFRYLESEELNSGRLCLENIPKDASSFQLNTIEYEGNEPRTLTLPAEPGIYWIGLPRVLPPPARMAIPMPPRIQPLRFTEFPRSFVFLPGFINTDFPRNDLACLKGDVKGAGDRPLHITVLAVDTVASYDIISDSSQYSLSFLQGERARMVVDSGEKIGVSKVFTIWNQYGHHKLADSPCQELETIALQEIPESWRGDREAMIRFIETGDFEKKENMDPATEEMSLREMTEPSPGAIP